MILLFVELLLKFNLKMNVEGKDLLYRYLRKNRGDSKLIQAATRFIADLEQIDVTSPENLYMFRKGIDKVHNEGFYFLT